MKKAIDWIKRKAPHQWLMDDWKREKVALYMVILLLLVMEAGQLIVSMGVYLKL